MQTTFELRRVTALIGPHGSGKTELAIGLALWAAQQILLNRGPVDQVALADLDVIKPYFRSREVADGLRAKGVGLVAPMGALAGADLPILTPELRGTVSRPDVQLLLDVGGDPVGARALGSISDVVGAAEYDLLLVLNRYRPFMDSLESVVEQARLIEAATQLALSGVVSNTHLLEETTAEDVFFGLELAREVARALGVPVRLCAIPEHLTAELGGRPELQPVVAIRRRMMPHFLGGVVFARPTSPLSGGIGRPR